MNTNALLKQGIAALKAGQKTEACRLLKQVVEQDKDNEAAWLWLSGAMDTDHERIRCLRETLRINPNNEHARHGLEKLESKVPASQSSSSQPKSSPFLLAEISERAARPGHRATGFQESITDFDP